MTCGGSASGNQPWWRHFELMTIILSTCLCYHTLILIFSFCFTPMCTHRIHCHTLLFLQSSYKKSSLHDTIQSVSYHLNSDINFLCKKNCCQLTVAPKHLHRDLEWHSDHLCSPTTLQNMSFSKHTISTSCRSCKTIQHRSHLYENENESPKL